VRAADIDETPARGENADVLVSRLAMGKASAIADGLRNSLVASESKEVWVLGSDTVVAINNIILGKPASKQDALRMLSLLSNCTHQVMTAVALVSVSTPVTQLTALSVSDVEFGAISADEIERYWASGEPCDKAGAYAIQGCAARWVKRIAGSYSGIIGLPLYDTRQLLQQAGFSC